MPDFIGNVTSTIGEAPKPYDIDDITDAMYQATDRQHRSNKELIEALLGLGFQVIIGGNRPSLPTATLPASYAAAYGEVVREARNRDPAENVYRSLGLGRYRSPLLDAHGTPFGFDIETDGSGQSWVNGKLL